MPRLDGRTSFGEMTMANCQGMIQAHPSALPDMFALLPVRQGSMDSVSR